MATEKEHTTRTRVLRVLRAILERPYGYTVHQLCERYGVSEDTIRGDFEAMRNADFVLDMDSRYRYAFVENKPMKQLKDLLHFTEEAIQGQCSLHGRLVLGIVRGLDLGH